MPVNANVADSRGRFTAVVPVRVGSPCGENLLKLLDWAFRPVATPADTVVCILDWMSAHCDPRIDDLLHSEEAFLLENPWVQH